MKLKSALVAVIAAVGALSAHAATANFTGYSVEYDATTSFGGIGFGFGDGTNEGFGWRVPTSMNVLSAGGTESATFDMPSFTITVNPGYTLAGLRGFIGKLVFNQFATGSTISASAIGSLSVDGGPAQSFGGALEASTTSSNAFASAGTLQGNGSAALAGFSTLSFSGGVLTISATAGAGGFASIVGQDQNELRFSTAVTAVPEPESYALMLAGLLAVGTLLRRRSA